MFSMSDHATPWARAASWFNPRSWPRTGAAFDGFLSIGPYRPKDGSHLCHHGNCINQHHLVYEDSGINGSRSRCSSGAQDMRLLGMDVPKHCPRHDPPCLLQVRAIISNVDQKTNETLECCLDPLRVISDTVLDFPPGKRSSVDPGAIAASGSPFSHL